MAKGGEGVKEGGGKIDHPVGRPTNPNYKPPPPKSKPWEDPKLADWQRAIEWARYDKGLCEGDVQREWDRLDTAIPGLNLRSRCLGNGGEGRSTAIKIATEQAMQLKREKDFIAFEIVVSTQFHKLDAVLMMRCIAVEKVAGYLRGLKELQGIGGKFASPTYLPKHPIKPKPKPERKKRRP
jgi:hypothetical protein